jgi:putative protease
MKIDLMQLVSPDIEDKVIYVGLKGFSRYSDENAMTLDEIKELCNSKRVYVALNRVVEFEKVREIIEKLNCEGFIINDLGTIWKLKKCKDNPDKRITSSVGLNPVNSLDLEFFKEVGVDIVVVPPELYDELPRLRGRGVQIESFGFALVEMFYKGKCLLSAYFDGISTKRKGTCTKKCLIKWDVILGDDFKGHISFPPKGTKFDVKADFVKIEGRQFKKFRNKKVSEV